LREQLANGGRLLIPVGGRDEQLLLRLTRRDNVIHTERLSGVRFVPLIGAHAWEPREGE
jgi:protein-L-isoaspartate(D-aspartate) O-methyltransferase